MAESVSVFVSVWHVIHRQRRTLKMPKRSFSVWRIELVSTRLRLRRPRACVVAWAEEEEG